MNWGGVDGADAVLRQEREELHFAAFAGYEIGGGGGRELDRVAEESEALTKEDHGSDDEGDERELRRHPSHRPDKLLDHGQKEHGT